LGVNAPIILDLKSDGPTNTNVSEALAAAMPRESELEEVPQETPVSSSELDALRQLGINPRALRNSEYIRNQELPAAVFDDSESLMNRIDNIASQVTEKRLLNERVSDVVLRYYEMIGFDPDEPDTPGNRPAQVRDALTQAYADYAQANPDMELSSAGFMAFLSNPEYAEIRTYFEQLEGLLVDIRLLGLTQWEYSDVVTSLLGEIGSTFISADDLHEMLISTKSVPVIEEPVEEDPVEEDVDPTSSLKDDG
ncbi:MAG: hypothetical protein O7G85_16210, partial [Planctomycetota bacterium]|nr:hypothetical protein [Planctomycetota bacterium]